MTAEEIFNQKMKSYAGAGMYPPALAISAMKEFGRQCVIEAVACAKEHTDCELDVEGAIANANRILKLAPELK